MDKQAPISGAIRMDDGKSKNKKPRDKNDKEAKDPKAVKSEDCLTASETAEKGNPLNPYCNCSPCTCPSPCTCGLELTAQEVRTEWCEHSGKLVYSMIETWVPKKGAKRLSD